MGRLFKNYENKITSEYGNRILNGFSSFHSGIDLVGKGDNNVSQLDYIIAHSDGTVSAVEKGIPGFLAGSYGNYVLISHDSTYSTLYAHMAYSSVTVKAGDKVTKGQVIGYMGNTGDSYGAHLHFEIRKNGTKIDPKPYINADLPNSLTSSTQNVAGTTSSFKSGDVIMLNNVNLYNSASANEAVNKKTGTFYIWSSDVDRGRIRITNLVDRVGVSGQVTGFIDVSDILKTGTVMNNTTSSSTTSFVKDGLDYGQIFNPTYYSDKYSDLKKVYGTDVTKLFNHFLNYGMKEGRQAISTFNVIAYKNNYEDLRKAFGDNIVSYYKHYLQYGYKENRKTI